MCEGWALLSVRYTELGLLIHVCRSSCPVATQESVLTAMEKNNALLRDRPIKVVNKRTNLPAWQVGPASHDRSTTAALFFLSLFARLHVSLSLSLSVGVHLCVCVRACIRAFGM